MSNVLVIEDNHLQRNRLVHIIKNIRNDIYVMEADSLHKAKEILTHYNIDLFYIDIELGDGSGVEFAKNIRDIKQYEFTWIVFITGYSHHIIEAFKSTHCYDYIIKPYDDEDIKKLTIKLLSRPLNCNREKDFLTFQMENIFIKIYYDDIYFIEAMGKHCNIHTVHGKYEIKHTSLKNILKMTKDSCLIQSHRSYIINTDRVNMISPCNGSWNVYFNGYDGTAIVGFTFRKYITLKLTPDK